MDGVALTISSLGFKFQSRNHLIRHDALALLIGHMDVTNDSQLSLVMLHALQCVCELEEGRKAVHDAGGTTSFLEMLSPSKELSYHTRIFEYAPETLAEIAMKGLHLLAHDAAAKESMKDVGAASVVENVLESPEFLKSKRARLARHRYGVPLLHLLSN